MFYRDRYGSGDAQARGPLAPFLGDPSRFTSPFDDVDCQWICVPDADGNPWFVIYRGPEGQFYNWPQIAKRNMAGSAGLLPFFHQAERANAAAAGIDVDPQAALVFLNAHTPAMPGDPPPELHAVLLRTPVDLVDGNPGVLMNAYAWDDIGPVRSGGAAAATHCSRVALTFQLRAQDGRLIQFYGVGNPHLRIAMITGFPGEIVGGSDWIPEAMETLLDVAKIIIGAFAFNVVAIVAAAADIAKTWYGYAQDLERQKELAGARGGLLAKLPTVGGSGPGAGVAGTGSGGPDGASPGGGGGGAQLQPKVTPITLGLLLLLVLL